jgi:archaellum component FlaD/FlaE
MADQKAFSDHIEKLLFIKRLQARENSFNKFLTGQGILAEGGGMAHGGGLGSGGGLDSSGFKNRRPAVQTAMLSNDKDDVDFMQAEINLTEIDNANMVEYKDAEPLESKAEEPKAQATNKKGKPKNITLNGVTKSIWNKSDVGNIQKIAEHTIGDYDKNQHDTKDFHGTTSKAVIFEKDGVVLKYKSISELSKAVGMSKYQLLKGFKPKKNGDSFYHEKLKGTLTFVNRKDL